MGVIRWIGYIVVAMIILSVIAGGGLLVLAGMAIISILTGIALAVTFVAYCLKSYFEDE